MSDLARSEAARPRGRPRSAANPSDPTVQGLDRAISLLELIARRPGLSLTDLAAESGQPIASAYRALVTLQARAWVEAVEPGPLWHIGPGAFRLGSAFLAHGGLETRARPLLAALAAESGETACLAVPLADRMLMLAQHESRAPIRAFFPPGDLAPMAASAGGKAVLAHLDEDTVVEMVDTLGLPRLTSLTLTSLPSLMRDLTRARDRGFALDDQEQTEGLRAVAAPVFDAMARPQAALIVAGPAFRFGLSEATRLGPRLAEVAATLTEAQGGRLPGV